MKTIVHILYSGLGGHSSVVFSLVEADVKKEFKHVLVFYGIEDMPMNTINKCKELNVEFFMVKKIVGLDSQAIKKVLAVLKQVSPDFIILHSVSLIVPVSGYTKFNKTFLVSAEHEANHVKTTKDWVWSFFVMVFANKVVYLTEQYRQEMQKALGLLYNKKKVSVINNGINTSFFKPAIKSQLHPASINIGMLARLSITKDQKTLIEAFKLLLDAHPELNLSLRIAGDGDRMEELISKVKELNIIDKVEFTGIISEAQTPGFLNDLDIYVHATLGETMSTSIMQAMSCGKAIIASDIPGINNMISHNETGILVPPSDKESLMKRIEELVLNPSLRVHLETNAAQYAQTYFSNQRMFRSYVNLFN